ncbi:DAZ-associated protein 2 [Ixodes scapularis]|nr:DAZ-associated protein 2 [Ixodes scapularis]
MSSYPGPHKEGLPMYPGASAPAYPGDPPPPYTAPYPAPYPAGGFPASHSLPSGGGYWPQPQTTQPMDHAAKMYPAPGQGYGQAPPAPPQYAGASYPQQPVVPQANQTTVYHVPDAFDAGARFSANTPASIPPPPPGVMPNAAQLAAMQGNQVVLGQKKSTFLSGTGGAGYTFW